MNNLLKSILSKIIDISVFIPLKMLGYLEYKQKIKQIRKSDYSAEDKMVLEHMARMMYVFHKPKVVWR